MQSSLIGDGSKLSSISLPRRRSCCREGWTRRWWRVGKRGDEVINARLLPFSRLKKEIRSSSSNPFQTLLEPVLVVFSYVHILIQKEGEDILITLWPGSEEKLPVSKTAEFEYETREIIGLNAHHLVCQWCSRLISGYRNHFSERANIADTIDRPPSTVSFIDIQITSIQESS